MNDWHIVEDEKPKRKPKDIPISKMWESIKGNHKLWDNIAVLVICWIILGAIGLCGLFVLQHPDLIPILVGIIFFVLTSCIIWFNIE